MFRLTNRLWFWQIIHHSAEQYQLVNCQKCTDIFCCQPILIAKIISFSEFCSKTVTLNRISRWVFLFFRMENYPKAKAKKYKKNLIRKCAYMPALSCNKPCQTPRFKTKRRRKGLEIGCGTRGIEERMKDTDHRAPKTESGGTNNYFFIRKLINN